MITTLIVATDGGPDSERVLPLVRALHALGDVDVERLTVVPTPADADAVIDGPGHRGPTDGWPACTRRVLVADDVAGAIAAEVNARPDALLVMPTSAKTPLLGHLLGSVSEAVLRLVERPVLLVGPHVPPALHWTRPTPIVCVHAGATCADTVDAVIAFGDAFTTGPPRIVEVVAAAEPLSEADVEGRGAELGQLATQLAVDGVDARVRLLRGGVPEIRLEELADRVLQPLFVVGSARWTGGRHLRSTTRQLVHRSSHPVLVVPVRSGPTDADRRAESTGLTGVPAS